MRKKVKATVHDPVTISYLDPRAMALEVLLIVTVAMVATQPTSEWMDGGGRW